MPESEGSMHPVLLVHEPVAVDGAVGGKESSLTTIGSADAVWGAVKAAGNVLMKSATPSTQPAESNTTPDGKHIF
jgi:hypothetical protein